MTMVKYERHIKYSISAIGVIFILIGILVDFSWIKDIGNSYAPDGKCTSCEMLNLAGVIFIATGAAVVIFANTQLKKWIREQDRFLSICKSLLVVFLILYLVLSQARTVSSDEYEHLHNAWLMLEGTIPYFSLKFVHMPMLEWINIIFIKITGESAIIIQTMRFIVFGFLCSSLWVTYAITKEIFESKRSGFLAVLMILANLVSIWESLDIRPDNIMIFFALLSFWFLVRYYTEARIIQLVLFACCACLSLLGKQNAAIFYSALGVTLIYDLLFVRKRFRLALVFFLIVAVVGVLVIDVFRNFLFINFKRHLIPSYIKFSPVKSLVEVWKFNPSIFVLFILQFFAGNKLSERYRDFKMYLTSVCVISFMFLFLMNRPHPQEMLMMVTFMSILGSGFLSKVFENMKMKLVYVLLAIIVAPGVIYTAYAAWKYPIFHDIEVTRCILAISEKDDLVFDSYGQAIFRHHPLEPYYLNYFPREFNRLDELKKSKVQFLIKDEYFDRLPGETLEWFEENFVETLENPKIFIRVNSDK